MTKDKRVDEWGDCLRCGHKWERHEELFLRPVIACGDCDCELPATEADATAADAERWADAGLKREDFV